MAEYNKKWADLFPATIGNQNRPAAGVDNTLPYETDKFPQHIANDPVRYDKMNAVVSQAMSNDERLNEKINKTNGDLAAHNKDPKAHATGISGNASTATKLQTPRTISLTGKAAGSTTFDGSANAAINVTSVNADTASKLSTARKINITGNATGAATFDGTSDVSINTTVNESKHAVNADVAKTLETTDANGVKSNGQFYWVGKEGQPAWLWGSNTKPSETYVYNPSNFHVAYADNDGNGENIANTYLKKSGGNMNGPLNFANATWNLVGDDSYIGDHNIGGTFCIKGANDNSGIALINVNNEADYARISYGGGNINFSKTIGGNLAGNADTATRANKVYGMYTANGGQQGPGFFGTNSAGFLMSNQSVDGHGEYKNWLYMDNYDGSDVGGATAIGVSREETRAYIMSSNADRKQWDRTAELLSSANYNLFAPTKTGGGASGTWGINISGNADNATKWNGIIDDHMTENNTNTWIPVYVDGKIQHTDRTKMTVGNADTVDGYHASDLISKIQDITPKTAAAAGQFRELVVNDSHQVKLPDGGTWAYFVYTYNSWSGDDSNGEHRTRTGAGIAAGGTVLHTDGSITSNTINAFHLSGTTGAGGADGNTIIVGGFCWRIA